MSGSPSRPSVMTVLGPVHPDDLGPVLMHEHLLCDLTRPDYRDEPGVEVEITLENAFDVNYRPADFPGNHRLGDLDRATREAALFRSDGGGTIVELSTIGLRGDPAGLAHVARAAGIRIVMGAGHYTQAYQEPAILELSAEALRDVILSQLLEGIGPGQIRCGIIGEIGCSWPLTAFERRSLTAAAQAQRATGIAITVHPGRHPQAPHEILDVLTAAGADLSRVVMGHMDRTYSDDGEVVALARRGCVVEFDFFGIETSKYWMGIHDLPTDWMRLRCLRRLFEADLGDRVVISHDICTRSRLRTLGGHGYGHLLRNGVPLMRERGFSEAEITMLLVETPRRLLATG